jgi:hypothetical protein
MSAQNREEIITCQCGCQSWIIGETGIRCPSCDYDITDDFPISVIERIDVREINKRIRGRTNGRGY